jgi:hypothetical protein
VELFERLSRHAEDVALRLPEVEAGQALELLASIGLARESALEASVEQGSVYTPVDVANQIVALAHLRIGGDICDPAVGGGVFLLAAAEALVAAGASPEMALDSLYGADVDSGAVTASRLALGTWARWRSVDPDSTAQTVERNIVVGDPLEQGLGCWPSRSEAPFAAVVGNPPFLGQMRDQTRRGAGRSAQLTEKFGRIASGYVDDALLFLAAAVEMVAHQGVVAMIQPESVLASSAGAEARRHLTERASITDMWLGDSSTFSNASVDVVALVLRVGASQGEVALHGRLGLRTSVPAPPSGRWSYLLAAHAGVPLHSFDRSRTLADIATVTADFRDRYYDLAAMVYEGEEGHPLATVGLIDPLLFLHGRRKVKFAKRSYDAPRVDISKAPSEVCERWLKERLKPKLLVATQTRVVECLADPEGDLVPSTPLLVVNPLDAANIWMIAAALSSPAVSAWAAAEAAGSGLAAGTVRLRANQLATAPLPTDEQAWTRGAEVAMGLSSGGRDRDGFVDLGNTMNVAYGIEGDEAEELLEWWITRLPQR